MSSSFLWSRLLRPANSTDVPTTQVLWVSYVLWNGTQRAQQRLSIQCATTPNTTVLIYQSWYPVVSTFGVCRMEGALGRRFA